MPRSGWKPTRFDGRDYPLEMAHVPRRDLDGTDAPRIEHPFAARDQRSVPCCVSCAVTVAMEALDHLTPQALELSPLYNYWRARELDGNTGKLVELSIRDGLQAAVHSGVSEMARHDVPFTRDGALEPPSEAADQSAEQRRLAAFDPVHEMPAYFTVSNPVQWISALRRRMPLVVGFWVTSAYHAITPAHPVHAPVPAEAATSGHCVAVLGYDDERSAFLVKDSRGAGWGDQGTWWMPYAVADSGLIESAYALGRVIEQ